MKLSMSNIAWSPSERLEAYHLLAASGLSGVEIAPGLLFSAADDPFNPTSVVANEALAEVNGAGLSLVSMQSLLFGVQGAALFEGKDARVSFMEGMVRAIHLAGRFEIPNLVFGSPAQRRVPQSLAMEDALEDAAQVFGKLGDEAARAGTKIAIEANPAVYETNFLNTFEETLDFVERVSHPAITMILDLGAMHINESFGDLPAILPSTADRLNHVHVSEPDLAPAPACSSDLAPVLSQLDRLGYDKAVSIEMRRPAGGLLVVQDAIDRLVQAANPLRVAHA